MSDPADQDTNAARAARAQARRDLAASGKAMMRYGRIDEIDRAFDVEFWQAQDTTARLKAGWELVEHYLIRQGRADELRLQRSVAFYGRQRRPVARGRRVRGDARDASGRRD